MRILTYTIHLEPAEEGGFIATVPTLPGCVTQGETYEEAVAMAQECIEGFLEALAEVGEPVPIEQPPTRSSDARILIKTTAGV